MKDIRIVIVSWNVAHLLERCLRSLPQACQGMDWECVVIDNDSKDASMETASQVAAEIGGGRIRVVQSGANLGFAKACNLGSKDGDARYFLYLNPDTECPAQAITRLVQKADAHPEAGIFGPKLVYPDGAYQESVRRFPTFWDQAGIIVKLSHFLPKLGIFKRYYARDLDPALEQDVDQVMGACFLVRGELVKKQLGFDERYFIWMEEVDYCKTAKQQGWTIRYIPGITVIHHQGKSFAQEFQPRKQRYFTASLKKYFDKWHPGPQAWAIRALAPLGQVMVWFLYASQQLWGRWLGLLLVVEGLSFLTLYQPVVMSLLAVVLAGCMAFVAWKRPWIGVAGLLGEILVGSKGAILFVGEHPQTTSVRILLVIAFFFGWVLNVLTSPEVRKRIQSWGKLFRGRWAYVALAMACAYAVVRGFMGPDAANVLKDANAWGYWILLLPVLDIVVQHGERLEGHAKQVLRVALVWLAAKTLFVSYIFSHGFGIAPRVYPWIRRTGIGEITLVTGNYFRIFFQSHIYAAISSVVAAIHLFFQQKPKSSWFLGSMVAVLLLGLSRSFFIGLAAGLCSTAFLLYKLRQKPTDPKGYAKALAASLGLGLLLGIGSVMLPFPPVDIASLSAVFGSRTDGAEAAVVSRWNLLTAVEQKIGQHPVVGSGFGATVTYETKDPRIVKQTGGTYTTYAYEWGWLEHWVKFGLVGIPLMAWIVLSLMWRIWKTVWGLEVRISAVAGLVVLVAIHVFTPYLNHPLGIAVLVFGEALVERSRRMVQ